MPVDYTICTAMMRVAEMFRDYFATLNDLQRRDAKEKLTYQAMPDVHKKASTAFKQA